MIFTHSKRLWTKCAALFLAAALAGCGTTTTVEKKKKPSAKQETESKEEKKEVKEATPDEPKEAEKEATPGNKKPRKIIIDTDTGADDAAALILAAKQKDIELLGVTTLVGNVDLEQSTQNALAALEVAGCDAPVYKGSEDTYTGRKVETFSVFGEDGMGDKDLIHPEGTAEREDAISFIIDTVNKYPGEVEIISLGPATNIAKAMEKDRKAMRRVKRIWSLGTAGHGPGNASPVAEFNVYHDAEAYRFMLDFGAPITVVGLDMCDEEAAWTAKQFKKLKKSGKAGKFVAKSFAKIREFYKENGSDTVMNCDPVAVLCALSDDFVEETVSSHGSCITERGETYAQVIFYREGFTYDAVKIKDDYVYNVDVVTKADKEHYFDRYLEAVRE